MSPNPHQAWRMALAQRLTDTLTRFDGVRAVVVAGSVGRGFADAYSDIELPIFWQYPPDDALRYSVIQSLDGELIFGYDGPSKEDQLRIDGVQMDLWHVSLQDEEAVLRQVLEEYSLDLSASNALDTLRSCIPLYGQEIVQAWKERAQVYPNELAIRMVTAYIGSFNINDLSLAVRREDPIGFHFHLTRQQQAVFLVLLALNRRYFPTFKWLYQTLVDMPLKPAQVEQRMRAAYNLPKDEAVDQTRQILIETLHLVETHFPLIDTSQPHRRVTVVRPAWQPILG
jgi:predicted nucleotidyltransferase